MAHQAVRDQIVGDLKLKFNVNLPDSVPLSVIANGFNAENADESFFECARKIHLKYIDSSRAMLEVNISSDARGQLMWIFQSGKNKTIGDVLPILEGAVREISKLMHHSCFRFMQSEVYQELKRITSESTA